MLEAEALLLVVELHAAHVEVELALALVVEDQSAQVDEELDLLEVVEVVHDSHEVADGVVLVEDGVVLVLVASQLL